MENRNFERYIAKSKISNSNPNSYFYGSRVSQKLHERKTRKRKRERQERNDLFPWILADRVPRFRSRQVRETDGRKRKRTEEEKRKRCLATLPQRRL